MGHQFAGAAAAGALVGLLVGACGSPEREASLPGVLDNAREQVASASSTTDGPEPTASSASTSGEVVAAELPPPDPSTFEGANRLLNLWVGPDGSALDVDVWARRTFESGPVKIAENVGFGELSAYFGAPPDHDLAVVSAGAGPDGSLLAEVFGAVGDEQVTTVVANSDRPEGVAAFTVWERGAEQAPSAPEPGRGLVVLVGANLRPFGDELLASVGSESFSVGDGSAECRRQRFEHVGVEPNVLTAGQRVELEVVPGPTRLSFHPWFPTADCDEPPVLGVTVDVSADTVRFVYVFTRTGSDLEALVVPVP